MLTGSKWKSWNLNPSESVDIAFGINAGYTKRSVQVEEARRYN